MDWARASAIGWLFNGRRVSSERLIPRWLFLRALGLIYFSTFFSLIFQVRGLIGPAGVLPAGSYLQAVAQSLGHWQRLGYAPTVLWVSSGPEMLSGLCWLGMIASVLLALNLWPRGMLVVCFVCFLSFVSAAQDFSGYQSDGMLLEAGFISFFFAPAGFRPRLGPMHPASRASLFLLQWECFRVYFESGAVKLLSGDPEWQPYGLADARHEWPGCDDWDSQRVSRSANHSPDHLYLNWLPRVHMAELRVSEQHALAGRWLDEPTQVKAFFGQLECSPSLRKLMGTPLLATLILNLYRKTPAIPENKASLYRAFVDLYSGGWDIAKGIHKAGHFAFIAGGLKQFPRP